MKIKKFTASNSREALKKVKEALGPDALILSNRPISGGVEIVALASEEAKALQQKASEADVPMPAKKIEGPVVKKVSFDAAAKAAEYENVFAARKSEPAREGVFVPRKSEPAHDSVFASRKSEPVREPAIASRKSEPVPAPLKAQAEQISLERMEMESLISEIKLMRSMLEEQLAGFAWGDMQRKEPVKMMMMRKMLAAGFSPRLGRQIIDKMPAMPDEKQAIEWLGTSLGRNLHIASVETDIVDRGGVFAIVGPTGVGKTTTTAKLAARCVVRHGADRLALVTTDSYRIGAQEQLRIYGRILGVPVHVIKDNSDLSYTLGELKEKHLVLIDTIGMSQKDQKVIDQISMLSGCETDVERILLLNATSGGETLDDVVRAYRGNGLSGCIVTKVDESVSLGATLDVIIRNKLMLHYVTNGQRVPEDLHPANAKYLLHRALKTGKESTAHSLSEQEYPLVMAASQALFSEAGA